MIKLNKRILLVLAVFIMIAFIPTAFASSIDDTGAVGLNNQSVTDSVSAIPDEIAVESVSQSEVDEELSVSDESDVLGDTWGLKSTPTPDTVENYDGSSKQISVVFSTNALTNCPGDLQYYSGGVYVFINHDDGSGTQAIKLVSGSLNNYQSVYSYSFTFDLSTIYNNLTSGTNVLTFGVQDSFFNGKSYTYEYNPLIVTIGGSSQPTDDVIYVDGFDGSDGGTGSENFPYHSLKKVLTTAANEGKEIRLLPGTYTFSETVNLYDRDFTLTALGEVNFTSTRALFNKNALGDVTFNGINFFNIASSTSAVLFSDSTFLQNGIGTINFNNCSFIANTAKNLIESSCNVNIKGCTFIDNNATSTSIQDGGLIENHYTDSSTIDISYSIFINNEIAEVKDVSNNVYGNPIIVDANNNQGPIVKFNYNFVDDNDGLTNAEISNNARITSNGYTKITSTVQNMDVGDTQDIIINFTKNNGGALDDYMPDLNVTLVPTVNFNSIPITITKNGGKGEYNAILPANSENVDIKAYNHVINTFTFNVTGESNLKDPNLVVSDSLAVNVTLNGTISISREGNGVISFVSDDESIAVVDNTGKVTGVSEGNVTITVYVDTDGEYAPDSKKVNVSVSLLSPNLTVSSESVTIDERQEAYITINRLGNGAISFVSDDVSIAEAYNYAGLNAIWGKSEGSTIITVNVAANGNYAAASKKINVTVKKPVYASIYYVDSSVASEGDGTNGSTYKTIEAAVAAANEHFIKDGTIIIKEGINGVYNVSSTMNVTKDMIIKADEGTDIAITSNFDGRIFSQTTKAIVNLTGLTFKDIEITSGAIFYQDYDTYDGVLNIYNCSFVNNTAPTLVKLYKTSATFKYVNFIENTVTASDSNGGLVNVAQAGTAYNIVGYKFEVSYSNIINNTYANGYVFTCKDGAEQALYANNNYWGSNELPANIFNRNGTDLTTDPENPDYEPYKYLNIDNFAILKVDVDSEVEAESANNLTLKFVSNGTEEDLADYLPDLTVNFASKGSFEPTITVISKNNAEDINYIAPETVGTDYISVNYGEYTLNTADVNVKPRPKMDTVISLVYDDSAKELTATLTTVEDLALSSTNVIVNVGGVDYTVKTNSRGMAVLSVDDLNPGSYVATASYNGNNRLNPSNASINIKITMDTVITLVYDADAKELTATLTTVKGLGLSRTPVYIDIGGVEHKVATNSRGVAKLSVADLNPGIYNVNASYKGNAKFNPSNENITINTKFDSCISLVYDADAKELTATLTTVEGTGLSSTNVVVNVGGVDYAVKTNSRGVAKLSVADLAPGSYVATASYNGNSRFNPTDASINIKVKTDTAITLVYDADAKELTATLTTVEGTGLSSTNVVVNVGGVDYAVKTNSRGVAKLSVADLAPGSYVATASYNGNSRFGSADASINIKVKTDTAITLVYDEAAKELVATLNIVDGGAISSTTVNINVDGVDYAIKTSSRGVAKVSTADLAPGSYVATASYNGNSRFGSSEATINMKVKTETVLSAVYDADAKEIAVTLTTVDGLKLSSTTVHINIDGVDYAVKTNSKGVAKLSTADMAPGSYTAFISYGGNSRFSSGNTTIDIEI